MKKGLALILAGSMLFLTGCAEIAGQVISSVVNGEEAEYEEEYEGEYEVDQVIAVDGYDIEVGFRDGWERRSDGETAFDLQCIYGDDDACASFFYFYYVDLTEDTTAEDVFEIQNQEIIGKRDHVVILEEASERKSGDKTIQSLLFSAENEGHKNYYYTHFVEFGKGSDQFAWVLFTCMPSDMDKFRAEFDEIIDSLEYTGEGTAL